ncbi:uncharacterized protein LOC120420861 [Culex pipiens pallens]|uniref:uncharacterized protein LOC120420861 n=1 Tax=Culex pipiens pallens TaxID=42434 RepID=UPI0022AAACD5|nr:uncharacterized protein LOC120420861 [Culex pipiens pallens]
MIPNVDQRIWIIFCWYLVLQCFFAGYDVVPTSSAAASSPNHEAAALDQSLRLLDDAELEMLGIRRPPGRSGSTYHETVTTTTTSSPSSSPSLSLFAPSRGSARINNNRKINLVSYTANLDNILNSLEDEDEEEDREDLEDDLDDLEEVVDRIPVSGAKLYERNHEAANAVQHRLLVNQIVQKYYPSRNHRRHRRSSALRRSARSSDLAQASSSSPSSTPKPPTESIVQQPSSSSSHQNNQHHQSSSVNYRTSDEHEQQQDSDNSDDKPETEGDGKKMAVKNAIRSNNSEHNFVRNATLANAQHSSSDKSRQGDEEATDVVPEVGQDQREATTATETNTSTMGAVTVTQAVKVAEAAATELTKPETTNTHQQSKSSANKLAQSHPFEERRAQECFLLALIFEPLKQLIPDPPKEPYLLIDQRRLDAGNMFIPVKENSELTLACVSEGGNPKPVLSWEVLLSPGIDRHAQKVSNDVLELQEIKREKDKEPSYKINTGAISEAKLPAVFRVHHNARILCVMEHPTLKMRQNASILLDVQYTPSFAITRTPGFGYPLREGIEVSLKCDVDSNPPSPPLWQKDDGDTPVPQTGDGFLNFSSIRREHSGWYKCTSRHLNFQYSSIGYYLSVRYDSVDVTSEPVEQDLPLSSSSSSSSASSSATSAAAGGGGGGGGGIGGLPNGANNFKGGQMEVELGGSVTLQCPQGSLGCWSHLDPITARLKGLGVGISTPTGQFSLKDVVYQDAGTYKCVGQSAANRKKLEVLQTVSIAVKGAPTVIARNTTPVAFPGSPLHLAVEFCANPPAYAARWLHGDLVYTPGKKYGDDVLAYGFIDLPTPFCKEARLTYVHMHEKVPRTFYFIVSSPGGVAEAIFNVNFTLKHKASSSSSSSGPGSSSSSGGGGGGSGTFGSVGPFGSSLSSAGGSLSSGGSGYKINTNTINNLPPNGNGLGDGGDGDEELMEPEEIHFPIFGSGAAASWRHFTATTAITTAATIATTTTTTIATTLYRCYSVLLLALLTCFRYVLY